MLFNAEAGNRLAGLGDTVDHTLGPLGLDTDNHAGGNVRVGTGADQRTEMEVKVGAELQAPVGMRQGNSTLDVVGNGLAGSVGKVVKGKDNNMIADADTAVVTAITHKCLLHFYHLFVFTL